MDENLALREFRNNSCTVMSECVHLRESGCPLSAGIWVSLDIGSVLRSQTGVKPLFVSPGHRVSIKTAPEVVLSCCTRYRLPEPTRTAHTMVTALKKTIPSS
ncbi:MAG: endonuclease V [Thermovirgaceae bacterium]